MVASCSFIRGAKIQPYHSVRLFVRFSSTETGPLPLPRSINPSKGLLILRVPVPPQHWPAKLELASPLIGLTSTKYKRHGIVVNAAWDGVGAETSFKEKEKYRADLYRPSGRVVEIDDYSIGDSRVLAAINVTGDGIKSDKSEILVCTHGSRDCRCADQGLPLVGALEQEIQRLGLDDRIRVSQVAHVGGHK
jgi:hypothetical protein